MKHGNGQASAEELHPEVVETESSKESSKLVDAEGIPRESGYYAKKDRSIPKKTIIGLPRVEVLASSNPSSSDSQLDAVEAKLQLSLRDFFQKSARDFVDYHWAKRSEYQEKLHAWFRWRPNWRSLSKIPAILRSDIRACRRAWTLRFRPSSAWEEVPETQGSSSFDDGSFDDDAVDMNDYATPLWPLRLGLVAAFSLTVLFSLLAAF